MVPFKIASDWRLARAFFMSLLLDRAGEAVAGAAGGVVTECLWADPDGRRLKKGNTLYFGYKGFWRSDGAGHVEVVPVRPANAGEAPHLPHLLKGCRAAHVLADKACSSETNRAALARQGLKSGDHVPGGTEPSARRLAEEIQPAGGEATLGH